MPFSYSSVEVGSNVYNVYASLDEANEYAEAAISSAADTWRDTVLTTDSVKGRALVSATRWLDSVAWAGTKTDDDQEQLWPRTGITDVADDAIPTQMLSACVELAMALVDDQDARTSITEPMQRAIRAGSVSLENFRPEGNVQTQTPFPATVMALISQWLAGSANAVSGAISYGTGCGSRLLDDEYDFEHGI